MYHVTNPAGLIAHDDFFSCGSEGKKYMSGNDVPMQALWVAGGRALIHAQSGR
jgi:hypothetical protein